MTTYTVPTETDSTERRSTDTSIRVHLEKDGHMIIENKGLIAYSGGAKLENAEEYSFLDRIRRSIGGDSLTARIITATAEEGATIEVGAGTVEPRAVIAVEVDSLNDRGITVADGAWVAHTDGVDSGTAWKGWESAIARERIAMPHFTGEGLVIIEGGGTLVEKTLAEGESIVLGQARLTAYSDEVELDSQNVAGRRLMTVTGPGVVVYKTHAENVND